VPLEVFHNCLGFNREGQLLSHEVESSESVDWRDGFLDLDHLKSKSLNFSENEDGHMDQDRIQNSERIYKVDVAVLD